MYKDKVMNRRTINKDIIYTIIDTLHSKHPEEKRHSITVKNYVEKLALPCIFLNQKSTN